MTIQGARFEGSGFEKGVSKKKGGDKKQNERASELSSRPSAFGAEIVGVVT